MPTKELKLPLLQRTVKIALREKIKARADDGDGADIEPDDDELELTFSSEEPYERWFGIEILGHKSSEVDLGWMASGRAPLLVDHQVSVDSQIGILSKVWLEDGRGKAIARFGKNARAQEIADRVKAGDLTNVSVGYRVLEMELVSTKKDGPDTYRVTRWQPMEASIVAIPADSTVGVGRNDDQLQAVRIISPHIAKSNLKGTSTMDPELQAALDAAAQRGVKGAWVTPDKPKEIEAKSEADLIKVERERMKEIEKIGAQFNKRDIASKAIHDGTSVADFRGIILNAVGEQTVQERNDAKNGIGLTKKEAQQFRFTRLMLGLVGQARGDKNLVDLAKFELDAVNAASEQKGNDIGKRGYALPIEVLRQPLVENTRALNIGTAAQGGNTMQTDLLEQDFISLLRNRMAATRMGSRFLSGMEGNFNIPRHTTASLGAWVAEGGAPATSTQAFDQVAFSPKTYGATVDYTRRMLLQSSMDVEAFVRDDITQVLSIGLDYASINGTGGTQPLGLAGQAGLNAIALGTNGAIPSWTDVLNMETQVAINNADLGNLGYLSNPKVRGKMKGVLKAAAASADFVWEGKGTTEGFQEMNGYKALATNQVLSNLTKGTSSGVCSQMFFGNWADLLIAQWSGIDLLVDPYSLSNTGSIRIVAFIDADVGVRHGNSFSYIADALTV
jgi:HK97 family phage major capsid protein